MRKSNIAFHLNETALRGNKMTVDEEIWAECFVCKLNDCDERFCPVEARKRVEKVKNLLQGKLADTSKPVKRYKCYSDEEAYKLHKAGLSYEKVGKKLGVSATTARRAIERECERRGERRQYYVVKTNYGTKNVAGKSALSIYLKTIHNRGEHVIDIEKVTV